MTVTRRTALKGLGALAGTAAAAQVLPGCESASSPSTMVFMMMENRTYDHFLGSRALLEGLPGDGLTAGITNLDMNGKPVGMTIPPITPAALCVDDPPHDWDSARVQWNNGKNDGFVKAFQTSWPNETGNVVMEFMTRDHLPVYYALADGYTSCDRWFASLMGPTLPNRMYWFAGQSNGAKSNDAIIQGAYIGVKTIFDLLDEKNIEWAYYYGDISFLMFLPQFSSDTRIKPYPSFIDDASGGNLPPIVFIDPSFTFNDYHPPHYPLVGEQLVSATYTALANSPYWNNSLMVLTFDEHGGFYDHVSPGTAPDARAAQGFNQLGFRVPALVIGPTVKTGNVCSVPLDHTSAIKHIENRYGLDALSMRDAAATDFSSCVEVVAPKAPITLPAVEVDESMLAPCGGDSLSDHIMSQWAQHAGINVAKQQLLARDGVYAIGDYLDKHNLGRIRRGR